MPIDKQVVGNAGLFYVCYQLSRLGWNVLPTSRNARGVDILAYHPDKPKPVTIQVKALSERKAVGLGDSRHLIADYLVVCVRAVGDHAAEPICHLLRTEDVIEEFKKGTKGFTIAKKDGKWWLEPKGYAGHPCDWEHWSNNIKEQP